ncbi:MAG: RIP metalloprotease RseP [Clostridia bacterium]|nr:RIP metalloprotease RseP [Clostridia bacterium]
MSIIIGALKVIFVLGFLILIHEGGHFLVAKACKVKVKEFSIGFGPKIFERKGKETKYTLRLVPFGGFVDMLGENEQIDEPGSFSSSPVWKRMAIVVAGATVNIVFGFIVYFSLIAIDFNQVSTTVNEILPEYSTNLIALENGDEIEKINNTKIHLKTDIDKVLSEVENPNLNLEIKRNGENKTINVVATKKISKYIGIYFGSTDSLDSEIQYIQPDSPAETAGLKKGDKIIGINGLQTENPIEISKNIITDIVELKIKRENKELIVNVNAKDVESYVLGVSFEKAEPNLLNRMYYGYWESIEYLKALGESIITLIKGDVQMDQMMGPIGISEVIVKTEGISQFVYFLSIISLSLGVSNLLPIPALDGGRLLLLIIEAIRRKPLKQQTEITIQMIGFSFIILLSLYISFNDIIRIF